MPQIVFYLLTLLFFFFTYCILNWGLNIQFGQAGILNFAYIAFVAIGAYFTGVLALPPPKPGSGISYILGGAHVPFPLNIICGGLAACGLGLLIGIIAFRRLRSDYLAIVMLSLSIVLYDIVTNYTPLFGGADGLNGVPKPFVAVLNLNPNSFLYVFTAFSFVVAGLLWFLMARITQAPFGRTLRSIRDDPDAARSLGKNVFRYQMAAMLIGSFYAGVGGGLIMEFSSAFNTSAWTSPETFVIFAALLIGGLANNLGAVIGAFTVPVLFVQLPKFLPQVPGHPALVPDIDNMLIGILLIAVLWFRPEGLFPERRPRADRWRRSLRLPGMHAVAPVGQVVSGSNAGR